MRDRTHQRHPDVDRDLASEADPDGERGPARYAELADELVGIAGVTPPTSTRGFGRTGLRYQNKIFVMFVRGRLVLKLPAERVDALIAAAEGIRFDANKGTAMKEWFSLDPGSDRSWLELAREALEFARSSHA